MERQLGSLGLSEGGMQSPLCAGLPVHVQGRDNLPVSDLVWRIVDLSPSGLLKREAFPVVPVACPIPDKFAFPSMKWLLSAAADLVVLANVARAGDNQQSSIHEFSAETWTISNEYGNITAPGNYPSQVHLDLHHAGIITNPYHGLNEFNLRWIAAQNWTYTSKPIKNIRQDSDTSTHLVFDGLDTYATIVFCNQTVGTADNQFRQWSFDVTDVFKKCPGQDPTISLNFGSVPRIVNALNASSSQGLYTRSLSKHPY